MKILIVTLGTRGDVQPYVALARGLQDRGHEVTIGTSALFRDFITGNGIAFGEIGASPQAAMAQDVSAIGGNLFKLLAWLRAQFERDSEQFAQDAIPLVTEHEAVVFAVFGFAAYFIARQQGKPTVAAYLQPITPTGDFPSPGVNVPAWLPLRRVFNRLSYVSTMLGLYAVARGGLNLLLEKHLGLPPMGWRDYWAMYQNNDMPIVYGYSPALLPRPREWDAHKHVVGYWQLPADEDYVPPAELAAFLDAGDPPVYVGFGSMTDADAAQVVEIVTAALAQTGQRAVLLGGWAGLGSGELPDNIQCVPSAPHDWLFPRCAAIVHHGGAGTTAAALRAGRPQVVVPFFADQPWWAQMVSERGVSAATIPRKALTASKLAAAIQRATSDDAMQARARELAGALEKEDGIADAVELIERYLGVAG